MTSCLPFSFGAHQVISKTLFDMNYKSNAIWTTPQHHVMFIGHFAINKTKMYWTAYEKCMCEDTQEMLQS